MNGVSSWQDYEYLIKLFAYLIKNSSLKIVSSKHNMFTPAIKEGDASYESLFIANIAESDNVYVYVVYVNP